MPESTSKKSNARLLRERHSRCNHCGYIGKEGALQKCGRCKDAYYCSKECQKKAWPAHKPVCNASVKSKEDVSEALGEDFTNLVDKWRNQHTAYLTTIAHFKIPGESIDEGVLLLDCTYKSSRKGPKLMHIQIEQAFACRMSDVAQNFGQEAVDSFRNLRNAPGKQKSDSMYNVLTVCRKEEGDGGIMVKVSCLLYDAEPRLHNEINMTLSDTNAKVKSIIELINTKEYWNDLI